MAIQMIFKRYEYKYLLTSGQKDAFLKAAEKHLEPDAFGRSTICNLYFDTPRYLLIRRSLENNIYKEKIRLRSYGRAQPSGPAFIELKKKYEKVVYKRRVCAEYRNAFQYLQGKDHTIAYSQIRAELDYALTQYSGLGPALDLSYDREAYYSREDPTLRITFDENIFWRKEELDLSAPIYGRELLEDGQVLMEIKAGCAIPLWLTHFLTEQNIYQTSYSKYGNAYKIMLREGLAVS